MLKNYLLLILLTIPAAAQEHAFWDDRQKVAFTVTAAIRGIDAVHTCRGLAQHPQLHLDGSMTYPRERWLPTQSCPLAVALITSGQGTQTLAQWLLHRRGHHRLERLLPWVWATPNVVGLGMRFDLKRP